MIRWVRRLLWAMIGDDGTGPIWQHLASDAREVMRLAYREVQAMGHPGLADEHILLGLLHEGSSPAAALLRERGLNLDIVRADLRAVGPTLDPRADPATALRSLGIDVDHIRYRLEATFGAQAVRTAERRVRRRSWWRGGHRKPRPMCAYVVAKRALQFAADNAQQRGTAEITPQDLLYGLLRDAQDPLGTQLSQRSRSALTIHGFNAGRPNPLQLILQGRGVDIHQLAIHLSASRS